MLLNAPLWYRRLYGKVYRLIRRQMVSLLNAFCSYKPWECKGNLISIRQTFCWHVRMATNETMREMVNQRRIGRK
jgi:hypothetical protein